MVSERLCAFIINEDTATIKSDQKSDTIEIILLL